MFSIFKRKFAFDTLLADIPSEEVRAVVNRAFNPARAAEAWLMDSGRPFTNADVVSLASLIEKRLPTN